jgi:hypothetical protein
VKQWFLMRFNAGILFANHYPYNLKFMDRKILAMLVMAFATAACDDNDNNKRDSRAKQAEVEKTAGAGQWRITSFMEDGVDETQDFNGYIFEFDSGSVLTATNGSNNLVGTWTVTGDDSGDDDMDELDDLDFNIAFTNPSAFQELSEDWEIVSVSNTKIELRHTSGGNGDTDLLTFEKV